MHTLYICTILLVSKSFAAASVIHVPAGEPTIQAGIDAASNGDTVIVAPGVYTGAGSYNINLSGKAIVVKSMSGPAATKLDLSGVAGTRQGFICNSGEGTSTVIEGFAVEQAAAVRGGGLFCEGSSPTIRNCQFVRCSASSGGGGVYTLRSSPLLSDCTFYRCSAIYGGGACFDSSSIEIVESEFDSCSVTNVGWLLGGAIFVGSTSIVNLQSTTFTRNYGKESAVGALCLGGAIYCDTASTLAIDSSTFIRNEPGTILGGANLGGAIYLDAAFATVRTSRFDSNGYNIGIYPPSAARADVRVSSDFLSVPNAVASGGAIFAFRSDLSVVSSVFANNAAPPYFAPDNRGGAIYCYESNTDITGSTFVNNVGRSGFAIFSRGSVLSVDSCIVAFNRGIVYGEGEPVASGAFVNVSIRVSCTDIYGNERGDWVGCIDSLANLYNNFSLDPQFCGRSVGNYNLQEDSPCRPEASPCGSLVGALPVEPGCNSCCEGRTGNADLADGVDLSDLSLLIAYLTIASPPLVACPDEANVNAVGSIDLSDLSALIAFITAGTYTLPWCP